jgi:hypothetical protein
MEFSNVKTGEYAWKICIPFFETPCKYWRKGYLYCLRCPQITPIKLGGGLYTFINPCSFFHQNVIAHTLTKLTRNLWVFRKNEMPTKACIPFFQTLWAFRFWISFFETLVIIFIYFILFYFIFPHDTWLVLNWYHRKKIKQLKKKKSNGLHVVQWRPRVSCQTEKKNSLKGPLLFQEYPGPRLLGTLHKMFNGETRGVSHHGLALYI